MDSLSIVEIAIVSGGLLVWLAYVTFIFAPAWSSYGRVWERFAAGFLSLYVLAAVLGAGIAIGFAVVWFYDRFA